MYRDLSRSGKWHSRVAALGVSEDEFWRKLVRANMPSDARFTDLSEEEALIEYAAQRAGCSVQRADYVLRLPALPGGIEAFAVDRFITALREAAPEFLDTAGSIEPRIEKSLLFPFLRRLQLFVAPCLATDLNARSRQGLLRGNTAEERFAYYQEACVTSAEWAAEVFSYYPVLVRRLARLIATRCAAMAEMLNRLSRDRGDIAAQFGIPFGDTGHLASVDGPLGDPHANGRGVFALTFNGGRRLIYKPRQLRLEVAFQHLLEWLNERSDGASHRVINMLDRGEYGWVEFISTEECESEAQIERFYNRQGSYLALLYVLGGRDFFYENVRANGEYPYLIDGECLVTPTSPQPNAVLCSTEGRRYMLESVLAIGLLPDWAWSTPSNSGVSLSSLGIVDGQRMPVATPFWENLGRDDLRLATRRETLMSDDQHLPRLRGKPIPLNNFSHSLIRGFKATYDLMTRERTALMACDGPLSVFKGAKSRVVLRQTMDYQRFLQEACHPDYLGNGIELDRLFERLFASISPRYPVEVIQAEIDQLQAIDFPYFTARTDSRSLWDAYGNEIMPNYFPETTEDGIARRLKRLSVDDRERQTRIIERSILLLEEPTQDTDESLVKVRSRDDNLAADVEKSRTQLIDEAIGIGNDILDVAIEDHESLTWIDLATDYTGKFTQSSLDLGLYESAEGIAIFLQSLASLTGCERFRTASHKIVRATALASLRTISEARSELATWVRVFPGPMTFPASSLYLCLRAEEAWGEPLLTSNYLDGALDWFEYGLLCKPRIDFLSGAAGIVHVLLMLYQRGCDRALDVAKSYGDLIRDQAVPQPDGGIAWKGSLFDHSVAGFSHGVSGVTPVLFALAEQLGDASLRECAYGSLYYDRSLYRDELHDWLDMRNPGYKEAAPFPAWCHGAGGIILSRLLCRPFVPEMQTELELDIDRGIDVLRRYKWDETDCLCHGNLGNLDIILSAGVALGKENYVSLAWEKMAYVWAQSRRRGVWRCGLAAKNVAIPGMFLGLAGIGHTLLRFIAPHEVPSLLWMQPPERYVVPPSLNVCDVHVERSGSLCG